jgi:hypothetical protein
MTRARWARVVKAVTWAYIGGYGVLRRLTVVRVMGGDTTAVEVDAGDEKREEESLSKVRSWIPKVTNQPFVILARCT